MTAATMVDATGRKDPLDANAPKGKGKAKTATKTKAKNPINGAIRKGEKARSKETAGDRKAAFQKILKQNGIEGVTGKQAEKLEADLAKYPGMVKSRKVGKVSKKVPQIHVRGDGTLAANDAAYAYLYASGRDSSVGELYDQAYNTIPTIRMTSGLAVGSPLLASQLGLPIVTVAGLAGAAIGANNAALVAGAGTLAVLSGGIAGGVVGATIGITIVIAAIPVTFFVAESMAQIASAALASFAKARPWLMDAIEYVVEAFYALWDGMCSLVWGEAEEGTARKNRGSARKKRK